MAVYDGGAFVGHIVTLWCHRDGVVVTAVIARHVVPFARVRLCQV